MSSSNASPTSSDTADPDSAHLDALPPPHDNPRPTGRGARTHALEAQMSDVLRLADLEPGPDDHDGDPGCDWHPRMDKVGVRDDAGNLRDLDEVEVDLHTMKPEAGEQYDGAITRALVDRDLGAAEDSDHSAAGVV